MNYDCQNMFCENVNGGKGLSDSEFPTHEEVVEQELDPELCQQCQPIKRGANLMRKQFKTIRGARLYASRMNRKGYLAFVNESNLIVSCYKENK